MSYAIAILTGGTSTERDVALASAASVQRAIGSKASVRIFDIPRDIDTFIAERATYDCVIPVFHGRGGEDGTIQGFLSTLEVPYIFSGVSAHATAIDKSRTNTIVAAAGVRTPAHQVVDRVGQASWTAPVVVKPIDGGSSVGVAIARSQAELDTAIEQALRHSSAVMVETYIVGREFSVAVIDVKGQVEALPVISIEPAHEFFDYASKYEAGLAVERCPADIDPDVATALQTAAVTVHQAIGCRHVSRSDFLLDGTGHIWFLEVNTIPGMSVLLPKALAAAGRDFGETLLSWVDEIVETQ